MTVLLIILTIGLVLSLGCGAAVWLVFRYRPVVDGNKPTEQATEGTTLAFRWRYIVLPLIILLLSVVLVLYFYGKLPAEVAYRFEPDGSPDEWLSRGAIILWALVPQFLLTLLAGAITLGIAKLGVLFRQTTPTGIKLERVLLLMGNMIGLPQVILCFTILDIFSYNSCQIRIMPLWVFALIVMGLGAIILGIFFIQAARQVLGASDSDTPQKPQGTEE